VATETNRLRRHLLSAACASLLAVSGQALAAAPAAPVAFDPSMLNAGTLEVPLNKSKVVSADRPIAKALIGSSDVADVLPLTDRSIFVLGKKMGTTSLTLYDAGGRVLSVMDVAVGPDVESLEAQFQQLIPGEQIEAHISNDSVVLSGMVNNPGAVDRAVQLAKTFAGDKVVNLISVGSSQQVMLEVKFAEVSRSAERDIGVNLFGGSANGRTTGLSGAGSGWVGASADGTTPAHFTTTGVSNVFGILRQSVTLGSVNIDAMLSALETRGLAKTLAQPTLLALSGEKASFLAGGEFPVPVAQSGSTGTGAGNNTAAITVQFKPFGVSLGFTPTVLGDKTINLMVEPEVSSIDPTASLTLNGITIPGLRTRRASTTLEQRAGESFAIAGLLSTDFKTAVNQVPLLGSIPIIGALFRSTQFQKGQTELLIVVTPHLVAPLQPGQVRLPTDRVKDPSEVDTFLLGQPYQAQKLAPVGAAPAETGAAQPAANPQSTNDTKATKGDGYAY
jgi:pilus assembly protein CpaC